MFSQANFIFLRRIRPFSPKIFQPFRFLKFQKFSEIKLSKNLNVYDFRVRKVDVICIFRVFQTALIFLALRLPKKRQFQIFRDILHFCV